MCIRWNAWKGKLMYCFHCLNTAWSSLKQGQKLQHFLLNRAAKFTSLCLEQGQGFVESADPPYPNSNSCWEPPTHPWEFWLWVLMPNATKFFFPISSTDVQWEGFHSWFCCGPRVGWLVTVLFYIHQWWEMTPDSAEGGIKIKCLRKDHHWHRILFHISVTKSTKCSPLLL